MVGTAVGLWFVIEGKKSVPVEVNTDVPLISVHVNADSLGPVLAAPTVDEDSSVGLDELSVWTVFVADVVEVATVFSVDTELRDSVTTGVSVMVEVKTTVLVDVLKPDVGKTGMEETLGKVWNPAVVFHQFVVQL